MVIFYNKKIFLLLRTYFIFFSNTNNIPPLNKLNGISASRKKKFSTCSFDVNSDKSITLSRSLSPLKQRSITPPPKSQCEFTNLPPLNSNLS